MTQESKNNVDTNMNAPPKLGLNIFSNLDVVLLTDSHLYGIRTDDFLHEEPPSVLMVIRQTEGLVDMRLISVVFTDEKNPWEGNRHFGRHVPYSTYRFRQTILVVSFKMIIKIKTK